MLVRSLRAQPLVFIFLAFCAFMYWITHQGPSVLPAPPASRIETVETAVSRKTPRIAIATFITDEKSYTHLSLQNKDRTCLAVVPSQEMLMHANRLCAPPWL